jgi:hypothetical protein
VEILSLSYISRYYTPEEKPFVLRRPYPAGRAAVSSLPGTGPPAHAPRHYHHVRPLVARTVKFSKPDDPPSQRLAGCPVVMGFHPLLLTFGSPLRSTQMGHTKPLPRPPGNMAEPGTPRGSCSLVWGVIKRVDVSCHPAQ